MHGSTFNPKKRTEKKKKKKTKKMDGKELPGPDAKAGQCSFEIVHGNKSGPKPESVTLVILKTFFYEQNRKKSESLVTSNGTSQSRPRH